MLLAEAKQSKHSTRKASSGGNGGLPSAGAHAETPTLGRYRSAAPLVGGCAHRLVPGLLGRMGCLLSVLQQLPNVFLDLDVLTEL